MQIEKWNHFRDNKRGHPEKVWTIRVVETPVNYDEIQL